MTVYTAACTYVRRSSLRSCYSLPLLSCIPHCAIADMCKRCLHTGTATRLTAAWEAELQSGTFSINAWAHMVYADVWPIKISKYNIIS